MKKTVKLPHLSEVLRRVVNAVVCLHDSPHRIAAGLGVGVFTGILPGTGPVAALFLATLLRVNRGSALAGSIATNTWLSIVTFLLSIKVGSAIMRLEWRAVHERIQLAIAAFRWDNLLHLSFFQLILPLIIGYVLVALLLGCAVYVCALPAAMLLQLRRGSRCPEASCSHGYEKDPHH